MVRSRPRIGGTVIFREPDRDVSLTSQRDGPSAWPQLALWTIRLVPVCDGTLMEILHLGFERLGPDAIADISRPGFSRHLRILRDHGRVVVERSGREQRYVINEAPIIEVRDRWMAQLAATR